jgi:hypothetical protein
MKYRYSDHAREQMASRAVTEDEVEATLATPFATRPGYKNRTNFFKVIKGHRIRVTVSDKVAIIVSVWKECL